ncbi:MAG: glycosyltransferase family 4 protein [Promethearchaeota archaeon]
MRICYLSYVLNIHDYRFLSALMKRNYDVYLISYLLKGRYSEVPKMIRDIRGLKIIQRKFNFTQEYKYIFPFMVVDFRNIIKRIKPDILHTGWVLREGLVGALSGFHPVLLMPYGSDILIEPERFLLRKMITKYAIKKADMITCDCETVKNRIIQLTGFQENRIVTFPWGIELENFYPDPEKAVRIRKKLEWVNKKILIMNRTFEEIYGIQYFIEALPDILSEEPTTRVILIGSGILEKQIHSLVTEKRLDNFVKFIGSISIEEMTYYLNAADIYVSTSLSDGTSLSLLEAMACNLPVVVTDIPANNEWITNGQNGFLVSPKNPSEVSKRVLTLLKNSNLREDMGQKNLSIARDKADWNKNIDKLEDIYKSLLDISK